MNAAYETAKRVALGLETEAAIVPGDDLWSVSVGGGVGIAAEMPFQYFEKGFEPPEEQVAQQAALMLYETEFAADRQQAEDHLTALIRALQAGNAEQVARLLTQAPPVQWLSLIFLDGETIKRDLTPALKQSSAACRAAVGKALDQALKQLVEFKALLETLKTCC